MPCSPTNADDLTIEDINAPIDKNEVRKLNVAASDYAMRGNEKMALKMYKKTLALATLEIGRIQRRMEMTSGEPEHIKHSIQQVLNDEWVDVALIIAEIKTMMAIIHERTGDYDRAIRCCHDANEVYERQMKRNSHQPETSIYRHAMSNSTKMKHMAQKLEEANSSFMSRKELHEASLSIHRELCRATDPCTREVLFDTIYDNLSAALALELQSLGKNHPEVAETLTFLSKLHLARNDKAKALASMEKATSVAEVALGNLHPRTAEKYHDLARQFEGAGRGKKDQEKAISYYEKAIDAYREADGDFSLLVGTISNDIGVLLLRQGKYDAAIRRLNDALAMYGASKESTEAICIDTAQVWRNLGECYVLQGSWDAAALHFDSALNVQRSSRRMFEAMTPGARQGIVPALVNDENIADTLKRLGKAYAEQHDYEQAEGKLLEALTLLQNIPESPTKQDQIANVLFCLAEVKEADSKLEEAIKLYEESLELRQFSDGLRQKDTNSNAIHCALCMAGIGGIHMKQNDYAEAMNIFNQAIQNAWRQELPEGHPVVQMLRGKLRRAEQGSKGEASSHGDRAKHVLASSECRDDQDTNHTRGSSNQFGAWFLTASRLEKRALHRKKKGDIPGAIESTKHVLEFRRAYAAKQPEGRKSWKANIQVASTLVSLANLLMIQEELREAETCFREALDLYRSSGATKNDEPVQEIQRELDRLKWQYKAAGNRR
eukprot:Nitzschia sp. Nitz4//scaffold196_size54656//10819//13057//NITZ4_006632-RA/size54656-augustus-gene-0.39-mRNA-1//-1//CDS//3329540405//5552//frame0